MTDSNLFRFEQLQPRADKNTFYVRKKFSVGQKTDGKRENRTENALGMGKTSVPSVVNNFVRGSQGEASLLHLPFPSGIWFAAGAAQC